MKQIAFLLFIFLSLAGCKHYHNITAHYNAYFLAKEKMLEAEKKIFSSRKDNYNRILYVIPLLDTNMLKGMKADFDDCIKKAAYAIERHEISNWTDDSYLLVGKARFYNREFSDAINTFKYINGTSKDKIMQEKALIELMRTYIETNQWNDADIVKNYLRKFEVSKPNLAQYYLVQAHLYRLRKDYERTAKSLDLALPDIKRGEKKARLLFLQGQLYQKLKNDKKAFENYAQVLRNKPPYELELQANLAMMLTGDSAKVFSAKTQKKLEKMLKDFKNQDYLDEIYYDLAMLELKRNDLRKAVSLLQKSAQAKGTGGQKPYAFLRLAEIHFDKLRDYETAKLYYDSTMALLPKDEEGYERIAKRYEVLDEFIKYLRIVQLEDSLQRMAKMPENELDAYLEASIARKVKAEKDLQKAREKAQKQTEAEKELLGKNTLQEEKNRQNSEWYFDNTTQVEAGKKEFRQKWGNRPLADNWRVLSRISNEIDETVSQQNLTIKEQTLAEQEQIREEVNNRKRAVKSQIPRSPEALQKSLQKWENASLNLAKLYHFQLDELPDAEKTYWSIPQKIQNSEYEPEVYYLLYLLYNQQKSTAKAQEMRNLIFQKFPNSIYAKLIENPNYLAESQAQNEVVQKEYAEIYENLYEKRQYQATINALDELQKKYPENTIPDKIEALKIIANARLHKKQEKLAEDLEVFFRKYPDSKIIQHFKKMGELKKE